MTMNRHTATAIDRAQHIRQSISDILTTRIGTRVMRRNYGSHLPDLVDAPINPETEMLLIAATVHALMLHEPRILLTRVQLHGVTASGLDLSIDGRDRNGTDISIDIPLQLKGSV